MNVDDAKTPIAIALCGRRTMPGGPVPEIITVLQDALDEARAGHLIGVSLGKVYDSASLKMCGVYACRGGVQPALLQASLLIAHSIEEHEPTEC